jgi:hypothetical protein
MATMYERIRAMRGEEFANAWARSRGIPIPDPAPSAPTQTPAPPARPATRPRIIELAERRSAEHAAARQPASNPIREAQSRQASRPASLAPIPVSQFPAPPRWPGSFNPSGGNAA